MGIKQFLTLGQRQRILFLIESGFGYVAIAKQCYLPVGTVKSVVEIYKRGHWAYFTDEKYSKPELSLNYKFEIVEEFLESGLPLKTFAREHGLAPSTLRTWLKKYKEGKIL